jgi:hypothetical protein
LQVPLIIGLENSSLSCLLNVRTNARSSSRNWTGLHYACAFRSIPGIFSILSNKLSDSLTAQSPDCTRPCDLLPLPELSLCTLYSWGVGSDYQLGYPKDRQHVAKRVDLGSWHQPTEYALCRSIAQIASYKYHSLVVTEHKTLWVFGCGRKGVLGTGNELSQIVPVLLPMKNVVQVAAGEMHSLCVKGI